MNLSYIRTFASQRFLHLLVVFCIIFASGEIAAAQASAVPTIAPDSGSYSGWVSVTITSSTSGDAIYYTLDGSEPNSNSLQYQGTFQLYTSTTVKAKVLNSGTMSDTVAVSYTITKPSGMRLWLRSDSGITVTTSTSGQQVISQWLDSSGTNKATASGSTCPVLSSSGANGKPAVMFDGTNQYLTLPNVMASATAGEIFAVLKAAVDNPGVDRGLWNWNYVIAGGVKYPSSDGRIMDNFGRGQSAGTVEIGDPTQALDQWHLYNVLSKSGEWTARINGLIQKQVTGVSPGFDITSTYLGQSSSYYGGTPKFAGSIAEVIIYDHALSDVERATVEKYLGLKYGLATVPATPTDPGATAISPTQVSLNWQGTLSSMLVQYEVERKAEGESGFSLMTTVYDGLSWIDQSAVAGKSYTYRIRGVTYAGKSGYSPEVTVQTPSIGTAMPVNGMRLWLKADAGVFNPVASWFDQANGMNAWAPSTVGRPSWSSTGANGKPAVMFDGTNQYLNLPNVMTSATAGEIFAVLKAAVDNPGVDRGLWNWNYTVSGGMKYPSSDGKIVDNFGQGYAAGPVGIGDPVQALDQWHLYNVLSKSGEWTARINGLIQKQVTGVSPGFDITSTYLGQSSSYYGGTPKFAGSIAEVIIYDHALSDAERATVNNYFFQKYYLYQSTVQTPVLSPAAASFGTSVAVTLYTNTPGATIRYTLDGSTPTQLSSAFVDGTPIVLTHSTTVKAIAFKDGMNPSDCVSGTYSTFSAPTLDSIPDQAVNPGSTLKIALKGRDSDIPAQTLTYSCSSALPEGATLNAATGEFVWNCPSTAAGTTTLVFIVADSGTPSLTGSATVNIRANVGPVLTNPAYGSVSLAGSPTLEKNANICVSASDLDGISKVEFYDGTSLIGTATGGNNGIFGVSWDITKVTNGSHTLSIKAYDHLGAVSELDNLSVTVQAAAPESPVFDAGQDGTTNKTQLILKGSAEQGCGIRFYISGTAFAQSALGKAGADGRFALPVSLQSGTNVVQATAVRTATSGATLESAKSSAITVVADWTIPSAPTNLAAEALAAGEINLNWRAPSVGAISQYRVYRSTSSFTTAAGLNPVATLASLSFRETPPTDATYYYAVSAVNTAGTESSLSNVVSVARDNVAPKAISIVYSQRGSSAPSPVLIEGVVDVSVTMSEKLMATPFLALAPSSGPIINVELVPVASGTNLYQGTFIISTAHASGTATAILSARDLAGNIGSGIDSGKTVLLDTAGPRIVELSPSITAIQNSGTAPVQLSFNAKLDEAVKTDSQGMPVAPMFYLVSQSGTIATCAGAATADALRWVVQFPAFSSQLGVTPETVSLQFSAKDCFDHQGTAIDPNHTFIVYQGDLPPLAAPAGLKAVSKQNGKIEVSWQATENADSARLYRKGPGDSNWGLIQTLSEMKYVDDPKTSATSGYISNGVYSYAVSSVRKEIGADGNPVYAESSLSGTVSAVSDDVAPAAPAIPVLELQSGGLQVIGSLVDGAAIYRAYRKDASGNVFQIASDSASPQILDAKPDPAQPYYYLTAVDAAGNESLPSPQAYNSHDLLPVQDLVVEQAEMSYPVLTWKKAPGNVSGYDLYAGASEEESKLNKELLMPDVDGKVSYVDVDWAGGAKRYTAVSVREVDGQRYESPRLSIFLPKVQIASSASNKLVRGLINTLKFTITNQSGELVTGARLVFAISGSGALASGTVHYSSGFELQDGESKEISVTVPGYAQLPQSSISSCVTLEAAPTDSAKSKVSRTVQVPVAEGGLSADILASGLVKGGNATAQFRLENPGTEKIEIVTACNNGKNDSGEVRFLLRDENGNVLANVPFKQLTQNDTNPGGAIINTSSGVTILRLNSGETFTSSTVAIPIPSSASQQVYIELQIDKIYADYATLPTSPTLDGLTSKRSFSLVAAPYSATIISATVNTEKQQAVISGSAAMRASQSTPAANVSVAVTVEIRGFERTYMVTTDAQGLFTYTFQPEPRETGGVYTTWASHPEITNRTPQATFTLGRIFADADEYSVQTRRNYSAETVLNIRNASAATESNIHLQYMGTSGTGGDIPGWVSVPDAITLSGSDSGVLKIGYSPDSSVPIGSGTFFFRLLGTGSDGTSHSWQDIKVSYEVAEAAPVLSTPSFVNTGARKPAESGSTVQPTLEKIDIGNIGTDSLENVKVSLLNTNGTQCPSWISVLGAADLGSIAAGAKQTVQISISPDASVPETVAGAPATIQTFKLRIESSNATMREIPIYVTITSGANGKALLHVYDLFMGYSSASMSPSQNTSYTGLPGAQILLQNENTEEILPVYTTDKDGQILTGDLPVGCYKIKVTADKHSAYQGRLWIKPGITVTQEINLTYQTVSIEWEVVSTTIVDHYKVSLQATYETNVPAPVVTIEPASFEIPSMNSGDTYTGQFVVTNKGLIDAETFTFSAPANDEYFNYELMEGLPSKLSSNQQVVIPYKIKCVKSLPGSGLSLANSGKNSEPVNIASEVLCRNIGSSSIGMMYEDEEFGLVPLTPVGGDCFTYQVCFPFSYCWTCPWNSALSYNNSGSSCYYYGYGSCGGGKYAVAVSLGTVAQTSGGGSGSGSSHSSPSGTSFGSDKAECVPPPCNTLPDPTKCPADGGCAAQEPAGSWVNLGTRDYSDAITDLSVPSSAGRISIVRTYAKNVWFWELLDKLQVTYNGQEIASVSKGNVTFTSRTTGTSQQYTFFDQTIRKTATGFEWSRTDSYWIHYNESLQPTELGKGSQTLVTFSINSDGNTVWTSTAGAQVAVVNYDTQGRVIQISPSGGQAVTYAYGQAGLLTNVSRGSVQKAVYEYDTKGRIVHKVTETEERKIDYDGAQVTGIYDAEGNGKFFEYRWDSATKQYYSRTVTSSGLVTEKTLNSSGRVIEQVVNGVQTLKRTISGHHEIEVGVDGAQTERETDTEGNIVRELSPDGGLTETEYDYVAKKPSSVVANGVKTTYVYDTSGNLLVQTDAVGTALQRVTRYEYNSLNQVVQKTDGTGRTTKYEYDPACGEVTREYDPNCPGYEKNYHYDARGYMDWSTDKLGRKTSYVYDDDGHKIQETDPAGFTTKYTYTGQNLTEVESGIGTGSVSHITRYQYDSSNRRIATYRVDDNGVDQLQSKTAYNSFGNAVTQTNALGQAVASEYDVQGHCTKAKKPYKSGATSDTAYEYDSYGRLVREIDPKGVITKTEYDIMGRVARKTEAAGLPEERSTAYAYDKNGNVTDITYASGTSSYVTHYAYDVLGHKISIGGDRELPKNYEYNADDTVAAETDGRGSRTEYSYTVTSTGRQITKKSGVNGNVVITVNEEDREGNVVCATDGAGNRRYIHYNAINQATDLSVAVSSSGSLADGWWNAAASRLTHKDYDAWGNETGSINALGATTSAHFDRLGRKTDSIDASGLRIEYTYDAADRLVAKTYPSVASAPTNQRTQETATYDPVSSQLAATADRAGVVTQYLDYDAALRPQTITNALGKATTYTYDNLGRVHSMADPYQNLTQVDYDQFDNAVKITYPDHPAGATGTAARIALIAYNNYGLRSDESGAGRYQIHYDYDLAGNLTAITDANQSVTRWDYDAQNRMVKKTYADGKWFGYSYYGTGKVSARTDGKGALTSYTYNAEGQLTGIAYPADPAVAFSYDAMGNRTGMVCASGTTVWTYNAAGTLSSESRSDTSSTVAYTYDAEKHRTSMTVTTGTGNISTTTYTYTESGQLSQIYDGAVSATQPFRYTWLPGTQLVQTVQTPAGVRTEKTYDDAMRLLSIKAYDAANTLVDSYAYTFDAASQRTSETTPNWVRKFEYDQQRQLTAAYRIVTGGTAKDANYNYAHQFDAIGNRLSASANGLATAYLPNNLNQYTSITPQGGTALQPTYDANGNMTSDGSQAYTFDDENRLTKVDRNGSASVSAYDALCRRVAYKKQTGETVTAETRYVYDGWNVVAELNASNNVKRRYTWGLDLSGTSQQEAGGVGGLLAMNIPSGYTTAGNYIYNYDGNGNITSMVRAADQAVVAKYEYGPLGQTVTASGAMATSNSYRFSTKSADDETGLVYYGYRYYNPAMGRWVNRDPMGENGGMNVMAFVENDCENKIDPLGLRNTYRGDIDGGGGGGGIGGITITPQIGGGPQIKINVGGNALAGLGALATALAITVTPDTRVNPNTNKTNKDDDIVNFIHYANKDLTGQVAHYNTHVTTRSFSTCLIAKMFTGGTFSSTCCYKCQVAGFRKAFKRIHDVEPVVEHDVIGGADDWIVIIENAAWFQSCEQMR